MHVEVTQSAEADVLKLAGNWNIERALEFKQTLMERLNSGDHITLDLEELTEMDLSCLQLLCAAHRACLKLGKQMDLHEKKSEALERVVRSAGFARTMGCHKNPNKNCLWVGGWKA